MISESADDGLRCEQFRQIAEIGGDVAWILAYPGRELSYVSTTAVTLLGHERAALVRELQGGGALAPLLAGLDERVRRFIGGDDSRRQLTRHLDWTRADGEKIALEVVSALVVDGTGKPTSVVGVVRDLSGRRLHEEQQKRFVSMLSHEFRTPLSTIDGAIQRLEATAHGADDATRQRYRKIQTAVDRLIAMLDHYLSPDRMAQIGRAPLKTGLSPVALLETGAAQARAAGRVVTVEVDGLPERLRCDPQALHLALEVLIDNALK